MRYQYQQADTTISECKRLGEHKAVRLIEASTQAMLDSLFVDSFLPWTLDSTWRSLVLYVAINQSRYIRPGVG